MGSKRVVSLGADRCVKVWRVLADLAKPLVLYYSLFFVVPVTHATSMGSDFFAHSRTEYIERNVHLGIFQARTVHSCFEAGSKVSAANGTHGEAR